MITGLAENYLLIIRLGQEPRDFRVGPDATRALTKLLDRGLITLENEYFRITDDGEDYLRGQGL